MPGGVLCVVGTRPEVIKMAPVVAALRCAGHPIPVVLAATGQHRGLLDQALADFSLRPDHDIQVMRPDQDLPELTARIVTGMAGVLGEIKPDLVMAQGDTTTVLGTALAAHYARVPFAHVEAGLRTHDRWAPFPEEMNRRLVTQLSELHFAPTSRAAANLRAEGVNPASIEVTGNTVVDALHAVLGRAPGLPPALEGRRFVLVTVHRRENFGTPLGQVIEAVARLLDRHQDLHVVVTLHPNPRLGSSWQERFGAHPRAHLVTPLGYPAFVAHMCCAELILSDSGGVQEEAPALGTPLLILRERTERPEALEASSVELVGTSVEAITTAANRYLSAPRVRRDKRSPFGDGRAAQRIARRVLAQLGIDPGPADDLPPWPDLRER